MNPISSSLNISMIPGVKKEPIKNVIEKLIPAVDAQLQEPFYVVEFDMQQTFDPERTKYLSETKRPEFTSKLEGLKNSIQADEEIYKKLVLLLAELPFDSLNGVRKRTCFSASLYDDVRFMQYIKHAATDEGMKFMYPEEDLKAQFREMSDQNTIKGKIRFEILIDWVKTLRPELVNSKEFERDMTQKVMLTADQFKGLLS